MRRRTFEVLDAARAAGIRYLDAARSYGRAEEFLAGWLAARGVARDDVTIGTKWGYTYTAAWRVDAERHEVKSHDLATLRRQWRETTALLDGRVDLLQVHSATLDSGILHAGDVLDELARLRADGAVRAIGLTLSGAGQAETLATAMALTRDGRRLFDVVQATWNLLEPSLEPALAAAHAAGLGAIVKEALANGRLVADQGGGRRARGGAPGAGVDAVALASVLERPWAEVVLSGASTVEQLRANVAATEVALDDKARHALAGLAMPVDAYWRSRVELPWT